MANHDGPFLFVPVGLSADDQVEGWRHVTAAFHPAFGAPFLASHDPAERLRRDRPLNAPDHETFHGGGKRGCIDYPAIDVVAQGAQP